MSVRIKTAVWWGETWDFDVTHETSDSQSTCSTSNSKKLYSRGRGYGVKKWDYLQITLVPLFLGVIYDPEKGSKSFFEKFPFLAVCRPKNPIFAPDSQKSAIRGTKRSLTHNCLEMQVPNSNYYVMLCCKPH